MCTEQKVIIFSFYKAPLRVIQQSLLRRSVVVIAIDGDLDHDAVDRRISDFRDNTSACVLLITKELGAHGLTFTEASVVIITNPEWNPAFDQQAIDRIHRITQTRPVTVFFLLYLGTIEDAIFNMQFDKQNQELLFWSKEEERVQALFNERRYTLQHPDSSWLLKAANFIPDDEWTARLGVNVRYVCVWHAWFERSL